MYETIGMARFFRKHQFSFTLQPSPSLFSLRVAVDYLLWVELYNAAPLSEMAAPAKVRPVKGGASRKEEDLTGTLGPYRVGEKIGKGAVPYTKL